MKLIYYIKLYVHARTFLRSVLLIQMHK